MERDRLSPDERLTNLCFVLPKDNISWSTLCLIFRKRKQFRSALRLSDETADTVSRLSDDVLSEIIAAVEPHTMYMTTAQAAQFVCDELETYVRRNGCNKGLHGGGLGVSDDVGMTMDIEAREKHADEECPVCAG
ncbi:hypothetical protein HYZ98_00150 [Candidatus Peregrinibacteria bacterium]|nr:hypothetical protein [Candidatus Peregrinibacteria bacterium]